LHFYFFFSNFVIMYILAENNSDSKICRNLKECPKIAK
jgi:hypothetical protein